MILLKAKDAQSVLPITRTKPMNTLAIINLARRYAKNIVACRWPDLPKAEATRKAKELADSPRLRALARINWTKANAKKVSA